MKRRLLYIDVSPFGIHVDLYNHCFYLREYFDIVCLCKYDAQNYIELEGVKIIRVNFKDGISKRIVLFRNIFKLISQSHYDNIIMCYFPGIALISPLLSRQNVLIDIRTAAVHPQKGKRVFYDLLFLLESFCFKNISTISEEVRHKLRLNSNKTIILPLGTNIIDLKKQKDNFVNLLYVGTLNGRKISQTVEGLSMFLKVYPKSKLKYTIIGSGDEVEVKKLNESILKFHLEDIIDYKGYITPSGLIPFYEKANIGISYVPMSEFYDHQPPTKTYEYLGAGIPVLATATNANTKILNPQCGVLHNDNPIDFYIGLKQIIDNLPLYDEASLKQSIKDFTWKEISDRLYESLKSLTTHE